MQGEQSKAILNISSWAKGFTCISSNSLSAFLLLTNHKSHCPAQAVSEKRWSDSQADRSRKGLDAETNYGAGISPTAGLAAAWAEGLLGSAEKRHHPQGGADTVSDALARHNLGRA